MGAASPKSENLDKVVISQKIALNQPARCVYAQAPGGSEDDPREQGCPGVAGIRPNPFPPRWWDRSRVFGHAPRRKDTNAAFSICLSFYQWSRVTSPDLHRAVREIEGGCDATVLCNQRGLARPSTPSRSRNKAWMRGSSPRKTTWVYCLEPPRLYCGENFSGQPLRTAGETISAPR